MILKSLLFAVVILSEPLFSKCLNLFEIKDHPAKDVNLSELLSQPMEKRSFQVFRVKPVTYFKVPLALVVSKKNPSNRALFNPETNQILNKLTIGSDVALPLERTNHFLILRRNYSNVIEAIVFENSSNSTQELTSIFRFMSFNKNIPYVLFESLIFYFSSQTSSFANFGSNIANHVLAVSTKLHGIFYLFNLTTSKVIPQKSYNGPVNALIQTDHENTFYMLRSLLEDDLDYTADERVDHFDLIMFEKTSRSSHETTRQKQKIALKNLSLSPIFISNSILVISEDRKIIALTQNPKSLLNDANFELQLKTKQLVVFDAESYAQLDFEESMVLLKAHGPFAEVNFQE